MKATRRGCLGQQYLFLGMLLLLVITGQMGCTATDHTGFAMWHLHQRDYDKAINSAKEAIAMDPNHAPAWYWLGVTYYDKKQWDEAISAFKKVIEIKSEGPQFVDSHTRLGYAYEQLGRYDEAIQTYERAIKLGAGDEDLERAKEGRAKHYFQRALIADKEGDLKRAFVELQQAWLLSEGGCHWGEANNIVKKAESKLVAEFRQGQELMKRGEPAKAIRHFRAALEFSWPSDKELLLYHIADSVHSLSEPLEPPEEARKLFGYGLAAAQQKDYTAAAKYFTQASQLALCWPEPYYNAAQMYGELKRYDEAIQQMKEYVLMAPPSLDVTPAKQKIYEWEYQLKRAIETSPPSAVSIPASGRLGIRFCNTSAIVAFLHGLPDTKSVRVTEVVSGSTAEEIGVKPGDAILAINEQSADCIGNFFSQWRSIKVGERFSLRLMRPTGQQRSELLILTGIKR